MSGDSVVVTHSLFQTETGSSILTSPHQFMVIRCGLFDVQNIIEEVHYSHSINGVIADECFALVYESRVYGGAIFGRPAMAGQWKKYANKPEGFLELRRLACLDEAPKNSESFFISKCLLMLKKIGYEAIISYADPNYGHTGAIYKASNFEYLGETSKGRVIYWKEKRYHDKAIRTNHNGKLKPFAEALRVALEKGEAYYQETVPKHIYLYKL